MPRPRISIAVLMLRVVTAAAGSAVYARVFRLVANAAPSTYNHDVAALFVLGIVLTALALAARKRHTAVQAMIQITLACLGFLTLIAVADLKSERPAFWWYQLTFALLVVGPLIARRRARTRMQRGPRRIWWMNTYEAIAFSFLNMLLVFTGIGIQFVTVILLGQTLFK